MASRVVTARALLLAAALAAPARAATVKLFAYDAKGLPLDLKGLSARLARADDKDPDPAKLPLWAVPVDGGTNVVRAVLSQQGPLVLATWPGGPAALSLVWPVKDDGYSGVSADNGGQGFADGAAVFLDEEIALTEHRLFEKSWRRRLDDWQPRYRAGRKARDLAADAGDALDKAAKIKDAPRRAAAFETALRATALAREKMLFEHGLQLALDKDRAKRLRFGLTLDDSLAARPGDFDNIADNVSRSGSNWVRVVFRPNPSDFVYADPKSFAPYDDAVAALRKRGLKVMGCVLDTAQWPRALTPSGYAARVRNVVLHFKGKADAWEIGSELNGDWLGGASHPLPMDEVFAIYAAGVNEAHADAPDAELVATLYWWEQTAPDRAHSLSGWLAKYVPRGFGDNLDVVGLDVFPEDNPAGLEFERAFDELYQAVPRPKQMLSSFGYVERDKVRGYWWLAPGDVDGARKDLLILYTTASCALSESVCGGFWWQTLDQMLPSDRRRPEDLYKAYARTLKQLGRKN